MRPERVAPVVLLAVILGQALGPDDPELSALLEAAFAQCRSFVIGYSYTHGGSKGRQEEECDKQFSQSVVVFCCCSVSRIPRATRLSHARDLPSSTISLHDVNHSCNHLWPIVSSIYTISHTGKSTMTTRSKPLEKFVQASSKCTVEVRTLFTSRTAIAHHISGSGVWQMHSSRIPERQKRHVRSRVLKA